MVRSSIQCMRNELMYRGPFRCHIKLILSLTFLVASYLNCRQVFIRGARHVLDKQIRFLNIDSKAIIKAGDNVSAHKDQKPTLKINGNEATAEYAYATLMAGCDPSDKKYLGMMFSAITVFEILREKGSTADFVLMVRMAANTDMESLPPKEEESIQKAGLKVMYLPKPTSTDDDNYLTAQMDKFRFLYLSKQYTKVIFMDADVVPMCNLDMFFEASKSGLLEKNVVVTERNTPANGGFFLLSLEERDHEKAYDIIRNKPAPFNKSIGWGHEIIHPDYFRLKFNAYPNHQWRFNAAQADQGFLYYWVKYVKKSVTIIVNADEGLYEDWSASLNGTVIQTYNGSKNIPSCRGKRKTYSPWYHHFFGTMKPWLWSHKSLLKHKNLENSHEVNNLREIWWHYLLKANKSRDLNLKIDSIKTMKASDTLPLGSWNEENMKLVNNMNRQQ